MNIEVIQYKSCKNQQAPTFTSTWFELDDSQLNSDIRITDFIDVLAHRNNNTCQETAKLLQKSFQSNMGFLWGKPASFKSTLVDEDRIIISLPTKIEPKTMRRMIYELKKNSN